MMEHWVLDNWDIGPLKKFSIDMEENISENENLPLKTTFQYSIIPFFHVRGINTKPQTTPLNSASCTNSETFNYGTLSKSEESIVEKLQMQHIPFIMNGIK